jgi:hypothetical protein
VAGAFSEEQHLRGLRVLLASRASQFTKMTTERYKGEAERIIGTLKARRSAWSDYCDPIAAIGCYRLFRKALYFLAPERKALEFEDVEG